MKYRPCKESLERYTNKEQRKENRRAAFENYKRKHYLSDYFFFCKSYCYHYYGVAQELIITKDQLIIDDLRERRGYGEITSPHTLVKYIKLVTVGKYRLHMYDTKNPYIYVLL